MKVDVIAVFNTDKKVKPLWMLRNGKKLKIDKINSEIKTNCFTIYHCSCEGEFIALGFDGKEWWID